MGCSSSSKTTSYRRTIDPQNDLLSSNYRPSKRPFFGLQFRRLLVGLVDVLCGFNLTVKIGLMVVLG